MLNRLLLGKQTDKIDELSADIEKNMIGIKAGKRRIKNYLAESLCSPKGIAASFSAGCLVEFTRSNGDSSEKNIPWSAITKNLIMLL